MVCAAMLNLAYLTVTNAMISSGRMWPLIWMNLAWAVCLLAGVSLLGPHWGGTGLVRLGYRGEISDTGLTLSHEIREAGGRGGVVNRSSLLFNTVHRLSETFRIILDAEYFLNTAEGGKESVEDIDEETFNFRPTFRWRFFRNTNLDLSYTYTWIQDDIDGSEVSRNLVSVILTIRHPLLNPM